MNITKRKKKAIVERILGLDDISTETQVFIIFIEVDKFPILDAIRRAAQRGWAHGGTPFMAIIVDSLWYNLAAAVALEEKTAQKRLKQKPRTADEISELNEIIVQTVFGTVDVEHERNTQNILILRWRR